MNSLKTTSILILSFALIIAAVFFYDFKRPHCANAQCTQAFSGMEYQECTTSWCNKCGNTSCGMGGRSNQSCFLQQVHIGDLGGGSDRAGCYMQGASARAWTQDDGIAQCRGACVSFY